MIPDWTHSPALMLDHAWGLMLAGQSDRNRPMRLAALATVGTGGRAMARMVVLRAVDRAAARVEVHTDTASAKLAEVTQTPDATLLLWDANAALQLRLGVSVHVATGDAAQTAWARIPDRARGVYGGTPPPGAALISPSDWQATPVQARFAVLDCAIATIDLLWLGPDLHHRAVYDRADGFAGQWVAP